MTEVGRTAVQDIARGDAVVAALVAAGSGQGVVGPATTAGDRTVIPLAETIFAGGYGGGADLGNTSPGGGGGGGGFGRSRVVAVVEVAPQGVTIRPVVDMSALAFAGIAAVLGLLGGRRRRFRR